MSRRPEALLRLVGRGGGAVPAAETRELAQLAAGGIPIAVIAASPDADAARLASLAGAVGGAPAWASRRARGAHQEIVPTRTGPFRRRPPPVRRDASPTHVPGSSGDVLWQLDAGRSTSAPSGPARRAPTCSGECPAVGGGRALPLGCGSSSATPGAAGAPRMSCARRCHDDDLGRLADRHGDVLVYARLALARRLDARLRPPRHRRSSALAAPSRGSTVSRATDDVAAPTSRPARGNPRPGSARGGTTRVEAIPALVQVIWQSGSQPNLPLLAVREAGGADLVELRVGVDERRQPAGLPS